MKDAKIVVLVTVPSAQVAEQIAVRLVERKLAACVSILPAVQSVYRWEGKVHQETELLLLVKTRLALFEDHLLPAITEIHPYKVPEIIALPIQAGLPNYLEWINQETH
jgi:periplasmic divalent cation tolerance protein